VCGLARKCLKTFVESWVFQRAILIAILINTLSMGVEHHDQPELLTSIVEISNIVFSTIFFCEMLLKVTAFELFEFYSFYYHITCDA
jgi:voltage-dependent calcium channel T type alpha-1G